MDIGAVQERIRELLGMFSHRVKQENISDRYDINRISESIMVPVLRLLYDYKKLRNLNFTDELNYPGIDIADDEARVAFQITSTSNNDKVIHTLEQIQKYHLDQKYDRFIIYILTTKKSKYSDKNYPKLKVEFKNDRDIWDYLDLSKKVSQINDAATLRKILEYLEDAIGRGQPFKHRPVETKTEELELNFIELDVPKKIYTAEIDIDNRFALIEKIQEKKYKPQYKISDRDIVCEFFNQNLYKYPKDFVCFEKKLVTFHDLSNDEHPFYAVIAPETIEEVETNTFFENEDGFDEGRERVLKDLLRRTLVRILVPYGIRWHDQEKLFFFDFNEDSEDYQVIHNSDYNRYERKIRWKERKSDERMVSFRRYPKDLPNQTYYYFHQAFKVKFNLIDDHWYLEITPDWHATKDGYTNSYYKNGRKYRIMFLSEKVKDKKAEENNQAVFNNFRFIRTFFRNINKPIFNKSFLSFGRDLRFASSPILEDKLWNPDYAHVDDSDLSEDTEKPKRGRGKRGKKNNLNFDNTNKDSNQKTLF